MDSYELMHHGIKGQKWGVRRYQNKDGSLTPAGKQRERTKTKGWSKEAKRAHNIERKSVKQMTNRELQELNKRQELESKYYQNNKSAIERGMKTAGAIAAGMGTIAALYNNGSNLIKIGKKVVTAIPKSRR